MQQQGFEPPTMKSQALNLIRSIRTVVKSELNDIPVDIKDSQ
jgi:hypothetical protein